MQKIINFFVVYKNGLLTGLLFLLAVFFTVQSHSYHTHKWIHSANFVSGNFYRLRSEVNDYFNLKQQNQKLLEENVALKNAIFSGTDTIAIDSLVREGNRFVFRTAKIINNSYRKHNNHLTLHAGSNQGIKPQMGVVSSDGVIGIIDQVSSSFSTAMSILHSKSSISVMLKKSGHFGSLTWDGKDPARLQLVDIARLAPVKKGDTVVTDGRSTIFPKGILIGTVEDFTLDQTENFFIIQVNLFHDMTAISPVYIVENVMSEEIQQLEEATADE